jgi:hypothetical protein
LNQIGFDLLNIGVYYCHDFEVLGFGD